MIDKVGLPILVQEAEVHLADLSSLLEARLAQVNQRIASGENEHIEVKRGGRWRLPYTRAERGMNDPFFESLKQVDIHAVFHFVNHQCQFMSEFTHVLHRYAGRKADQRTLTACVLACGTNMGLGRMAQISDIGYQELATTSNNFIRLETLQKANLLSPTRSPNCLYSSNTPWLESFTPAVMDRNLRPYFTPSMPVIPRNTSE